MTRTRFAAAAIAGAALFFAASHAALAHGPNGTMSERGYERMRDFAVELDDRAQHANDQAAHQNDWFYGHDRLFVRTISNFARRARQFAARMENYRTQPWQVDDELRLLLQDAHTVQYRLRRSRNADEHTVEDWNRTVGLLNRMTRLYQADVSGRFDDRSPDYRREPYDRGRPAQDPYDRGYGSDRGYGTEGGLAPLARDFAGRSARLEERARQLSGPFPLDERQRMAWQSIQNVSRDASELDAELQRGGAERDLRARIARLANEANDADQQMGVGNVFPELRGEWSQAMQLLQRLRETAGV